MSTITIGIDLAKSVFSTCTMDEHGHVLDRKDLKRDAFALWLAQIPAGTWVVMEACSGAHHWARRCRAYGLEPRLIAAFVTRQAHDAKSKHAGQSADKQTSEAQGERITLMVLTGSLLWNS